MWALLTIVAVCAAAIAHPMLAVGVIAVRIIVEAIDRSTAIQMVQTSALLTLVEESQRSAEDDERTAEERALDERLALYRGAK